MPPIVIWPIVAWIVLAKSVRSLRRNRQPSFSSARKLRRVDPLLPDARRHDHGRQEQRRPEVRGGVDPERERQGRAEGRHEHGGQG